MAHAARGLLGHGHSGASVWVVRENERACERLGGAPCVEQGDTLAGLPILTLGYGWSSLDGLASPVWRRQDRTGLLRHLGPRQHA